MVYLLKSGNYLKIGYSKDQETYKRRLLDYMCHNPNFEVLEIAEDADSADEAQLHKLCEDYKYRTEWFIECREVYDIWTEFSKNHHIKRENPIYQTYERFDDFVSDYSDAQKEILDNFPVGAVIPRKKIKAIIKDIHLKYRLPVNVKATSLIEYGIAYKPVSIILDNKIVSAFKILAHPFKPTNKE